MLYWPTSLFFPHLTEQSKQELVAVGQLDAVLSDVTMGACYQIAAQTPGINTPLMLIRNEGTPARRVYLVRPSDEDWQALERGGFVADSFGFGFALDALH